MKFLGFFPQNQLPDLTSSSMSLPLPTPSSLPLWQISPWGNLRGVHTSSANDIFQGEFLPPMIFCLMETLTVSKLQSTWSVKLFNNCPIYLWSSLWSIWQWELITDVALSHRIFAADQSGLVQPELLRGVQCICAHFGRKKPWSSSSPLPGYCP